MHLGRAVSYQVEDPGSCDHSKGVWSDEERRGGGRGRGREKGRKKGKRKVVGKEGRRRREGSIML